MSGTDKHAAILGDQREDVAGRHDVPEVLGGIDGDGDGMRAVMRRDAGAYAFARLDGHGEGRGVARAVRARHQLEMKLLGAVGVERQADKPAAMLGHEIDGVRRCHLRGDDEVALVLALLCIDEDEHAPVAGVFDDLLDGGQRRVILGVAYDIHCFYRSCSDMARLAAKRPAAMRST